MTANVVVVGGGYGGITVAKALDDVADVVLVEPRDAFVHNVAALRGLVDAQWADRLFLPYDRLLARGRVVRDRAVRADDDGVTLGSGERIAADYTVLATGSAYPFPAKFTDEDSTEAKAALGAARAELEKADRVLLLGAGPVGLELAGEITAAWPAKNVTIVDPAEDILTGRFPDELRADLRRQLGELGVDLVLGASLTAEPPTAMGRAGEFTVATGDGRPITADIWFRCFGVVPASGYLSDGLAAARRADGHIEVTPHLRVVGRERVFAIGDVTALPEAKTAKAAGDHAEVVAATITALINGDPAPEGYTPGAPAIALPLGPAGGATYSEATGLLDAATTARIKGADLRTGVYAEALGR
ncbi:FAD-dependent oxidoreductase [Nocardiopsis sediminis]|uniref:FAD-dependent oxidoreductase n=1 Tax=Nocardiopsis sediminis TaxID=1778267 RepID=A0ABV8FS24_9ACTN